MRVYNIETDEYIDKLDSIKDAEFIKFLHEVYIEDDFNIVGDLCLEDWEYEEQYQKDKEYFYNNLKENKNESNTEKDRGKTRRL